MTSRLENAIKQLTPAEVQELEQYAEDLARRHQPADRSKRLKLDWAGKLDVPYETGLEFEEAAKKKWLKKFDAEGE